MHATGSRMVGVYNYELRVTNDEHEITRMGAAMPGTMWARNSASAPCVALNIQLVPPNRRGE
jgi:hypothetical protein